VVFLAPPTCSIQVGSPSVGFTRFHFLHTIGNMANFDDEDALNDLNDLHLDPDTDLEQEIFFDQEFTSSGDLSYLVDHVLAPDRLALMAFFVLHGVIDLDDFMSFTDIDFKQTHSVSSDIDTPITLSTVSIKKLLSIQSWYNKLLLEFNGDPIHLFYSLNPESLTIWRRIESNQRFDTRPPATPLPPATLPPMIPLPAPPTSTFRHSIKINISDYPKLKDETQWRAFDRQLRSTAASHDTLDILTPNYVPPALAVATFRDKQRFMYNVFTNIIHTTKGKNCVREESTSLDAQKVYASLLDAYHDHLSTKLSASKLRQELTLMKLDDKWRKSFESFLHFWTAKVQDLEAIEDKLVDDDTRRIWLTQTLSSQPDMDAAIRQTITTELTIHGSAGSPTTTTIPWINFYNMVLSNAKLLDSTRSKQTQRRQETNQANSTRNNITRGNNLVNSTTPSTPTPVVKWTGKNMVMKKGMHFSPEDWKKVTPAQKTQIYAFRKAKKTTAASITVSVNNTAIHSAPATAATPTPPTVMTTSTDVQHLLSNNTSRDSNSVPSRVVIDGCTYNLSYCDRTYSIHQNLQRPCGSLIDGGANGGLSGSDVVVLSETLFTADVTGIAYNTESPCLHCCWPNPDSTWPCHWKFPPICTLWHW
jgi:hypothetical protein